MQDHERLVELEDGVLDSYLADKPDEIDRLYARVLLEGERNATLNHMRAGLAAIELGELILAADSFDEVLLNIETVYAESKEAEKARSTFVKENYKDFKGEPYERVMAYYYRGLLYLMEGDYENARASFKGGMIQDTFAEDQRYDADFASIAYLEGWSSHCNGDADMAAEAFEEASEYNSDLRVPEDGHNLLVIAEAGPAPRKVQRGDNLEYLQYVRGGVSAARVPLITIDTQPVNLPEADNLYWQAITRGDRQIDGVLQGQAVFKEDVDTAGQAAAAIGLATMTAGAYSGNDNATMAGGAIVLIGLIAQGIAEAMRPEADIRQWDNLPERLHLATAQLLEGAEMTVEYGDGTKESGDAEAVQVFSAGECSLAWTRDRSALDVADSAPGAIAEEASVR